MTVIEVPDDQAAALKAKAAAQGLTLEAFFRNWLRVNRPLGHPYPLVRPRPAFSNCKNASSQIPKAGPFTITSITAAPKWLPL